MPSGSPGDVSATQNGSVEIESMGPVTSGSHFLAIGREYLGFRVLGLRVWMSSFGGLGPGNSLWDPDTVQVRFS